MASEPVYSMIWSLGIVDIIDQFQITAHLNIPNSQIDENLNLQRLPGKT